MNEQEVYNSLTASEKARLGTLSPLERINAVRARDEASIPKLDPSTAYKLEQFFNGLPPEHKRQFAGVNPTRRIERLFELQDYADRHEGDLPQIKGY